MDLTFDSNNEVGVEREKENSSIKRKMNIQVVVRCRTRIEHEITVNSPVIIKTTPREILIEQLSAEKPSKAYTFDRVFGPEEGQARIFEHTIVPILHEVKAGYNCTLLAYGQTSTGKTYTIEGDLGTTDGEHAGIIPRTLFKLFQDLEAEVQDFSVKVSYVKLYEEDLKDILSPNDQRELKILGERTKEGKLISNEDVVIKSANDGIRILKQDPIKRHTIQTNYNKNLSHPYSVFSITVHIKETMPDGGDLLKVGKFNLVDLMGSETEDNQENAKDNINTSILTLDQCINVLFRENQLTRLLKDSLGEKTKLCIIATISPAKLSYDETISTLDFAYRAKKICNEQKPLIKENVEISEIERLKMDLQAARERKGYYMSQESYQLLADENQSRNDENEKLQNENEKLQSENKKLQRKIDELQEENTRLREENEGLEDEKDDLQGEYDDLEGEFEDLEVKHGELIKKLQRENELRK